MNDREKIIARADLAHAFASLYQTATDLEAIEADRARGAGALAPLVRRIRAATELAERTCWRALGSCNG
jgi:hypothetical protein